VDQILPGCACYGVDYISVAGQLDLDGATATGFARRSARRSYKQIAGEDEVSGDGLVPVDSALLKGARAVELNDTAHGGLFGSTWYGSAERIPQWWNQVVEAGA
jgi:hypothetical protein